VFAKIVTKSVKSDWWVWKIYAEELQYHKISDRCPYSQNTYKAYTPTYKTTLRTFYALLSMLI